MKESTTKKKFSKKKKIILITTVFILISAVVVVCYFFNPYYWHLGNYYEKIYDYNHPQTPVNSAKGIDSVLQKFNLVAYSQLDRNYISYSKSDDKKFRKVLSTKTYYEIQGQDIFKFLVGTFRIKDFLAKDHYYYENLKNLGANKKQYLLIDKNLLYALLQLQKQLDSLGYNKNAFTINSTHRHPGLNKDVGGASLSFHTQGKAIDLTIWDIDKNGIPNKADKEIVLKILNEKIIKDKGGIGRYPWSMVVHFDVRGYKARWDKQ